MSEEQLSDAEIATQMKEALAAEDPDTLEDLGNGDGEGDADLTLSEVEQQAIDMGWNPEGVEGKRNISAEEFVERKSLFDRIHKLEKQTKTSDKVITALKKYNEQISEKAYERAIADLRQQKLQALEDGDNVRVLELDDEIEKTRAEKPTSLPVEQQEAYSPEEWNTGFTQFASQNVWYGRRPDMTTTADQIGAAYKESNPDVSPEELFVYVQSEIKSKYSSFFDDKPAPRKVDSGSRRTTPAKGKKSLKDVPEEDREIALTLIRTGTISEEEYIKSYFGEK